MVVEDTRGEGGLTAEGVRYVITYGLTVTQRGGMKDGSGQIIAKEATLFAAYSSSDTVYLETKDGRVAPIIITRYMVGTGLAEFKLAGAIIGPANPSML